MCSSWFPAVSHKYRWRPVWDPNLQHSGCAQSPNSVPGFACHCSKMPEKGLMSEELAGVRNPCWECGKVERRTCNPWTPNSSGYPAGLSDRSHSCLKTRPLPGSCMARLPGAGTQSNCYKPRAMTSGALTTALLKQHDESKSPSAEPQCSGIWSLFCWFCADVL